jgi:hypothetical protein
LDAIFGAPYPEVLLFLPAPPFAAIAMLFAGLKNGTGIAFSLPVTPVFPVRACL